MATHSCTLAWKIPWMEEPDRLQSMGSQKVRHDWVTEQINLSLHHEPAGASLPSLGAWCQDFLDISGWGVWHACQLN